MKNITIFKVSVPGTILAIAQRWRIEKGGLKPRTMEEHLRNAQAYCNFICPIDPKTRMPYPSLN